MKISYAFVNGETAEVEVSESIGAVIVDSRKREESDNRRERRYNYSLDAITYEGDEYGGNDFAEEMFDDCHERDTRVRDAFSHLSEVQKRRLIMLAAGLSVREIARQEGKNFKSVYESIEAAKKKFLKHF